MIHTITIWNFFSQWPPHREIKWQQLKAKGELAHVLTDAEITRLFLWGRDILKHDNRRMYWHQHKHRSGGHTAAEALFQDELCAVGNAHAHTHWAIHVQITSCRSCAHAQTRLSLLITANSGGTGSRPISHKSGSQSPCRRCYTTPKTCSSAHHPS